MIEQQYEIRDLIGEGSYGFVYQAFDNINNKMVAIKFFKQKFEGLSYSVLREVAHLKRLQGHQNIIKIIEIDPNFNGYQQFAIIFELMESDLSYLIQRNIKMDYRQIFKQILLGIDYMHTNNILHRDLKPQNILIRGQNVKLADFGLSRNFEPLQKLTLEISTLWYKPPEIILGDQQYSYGIDIWSLGCIFYEIVMKQPLFQGDTHFDVLTQIFQKLGTPSQEFFDQFKLKDFKFPKYEPIYFPQDLRLNMNLIDLLKSLLHIDKRKRISAAQALRHKYFIM